MIRTLFALALLATPAAAQVVILTKPTQHTNTTKTHNTPTNHHNKTKPTAGLTKDGKYVIELMLSPSGSWSVIRTDARGLTCILATGKDWLADDSAPATPGNPT